MISQLARMILPHKIRITLGVWAINKASSSWGLLKWYLTLMHGKPPKNMGLVNGRCYYDYRGYRILAPSNAAGVFLEIFQDKVYEQVFQPRIEDIVVDIGAYVGMFTVKASMAVGKKGRVIAIEPSPENYAALIGNCRRLGNVTLIQKAIMDKNGTANLYYSKSAAANSLVIKWKDYVKVETITLDDLLRSLKVDDVDFIKVDAEGAELQVLKGAKETLAKGVRLAIAAYHTTENGESEIKQVSRFLDESGYKVIRVKGLRSYLYAEKR